MSHTPESTLISPADRIRGAVWGSLVGDAFCLGSHWIYSLEELATRFPAGVQGFETPSPGHYHWGKKSGDVTHYGDAALLMLASVARCGHFDATDFGARFVGLMTDETYTGYRDHATKAMIAAYRTCLENHPGTPFDFQQGSDDDQPATVTRLAPVVAAHLNDRNLLDTVAQVTRVCQNNQRAIAYAQATALILRGLLNGSTPQEAAAETGRLLAPADEAHAEVIERMQAAAAAKNLSVRDATMLFGQSCPLSSSFTAALQTLYSCPDDFPGALAATANAGGDSAGRAAMIGAWLGAHLGIQAIPPAWRLQVNAQRQIEADLETIMAGLPLPDNS